MQGGDAAQLKPHIPHGHGDGDAEPGWLQGASQCPGKSSFPMAVLSHSNPPSGLFAQVDFALQQEEAQSHEIQEGVVSQPAVNFGAFWPGIVLVPLPFSISVSL